MSFAIEPTVNPTLDIPAPIVSVPQAGDRTSGSAPSFQDHLDRAGRSTDASNSASSSNAVRNERADEQARRDDDAGDRAEAERRDDAAAAENRDAESNAPKADGTKPRPTGGETKVEGKKPDDHHKKDEKKQGDDATAAAAVIVAAQETPAQDEVTLTTDSTVTEVDAKGAEIAQPTDGKKKGQGNDSPLDPTLGKQLNGEDKAKVAATAASDDERAAAALAEAQANGDAAKQSAAGASEEAPTAPLVSDLHSTKVAKADDKKPKTRAEFAGETQATDAKSDAAGTGVIDATATAPTTEPDSPIVENATAPEKGNGKSGDASGTNVDSGFAAQLQGAVEAAAAATTATTTSGVADSTTNLDTSTPASTTTAVSADSAKTPTTKSTDTVLTAAEALRSNSAKDSTSTRVRGEEDRQADGLSTADRARLVQRVARAVRTAQDRGGELQIRLSPPELGQLRLQIQMTDGTLSARIEAESPQAKQVITENLGQLRERLAEQNVRVDRIDVELMNTGNGGSPNLPDRRQDFSHDGPTPRGFATNGRGGASGDAAVVEPSTSNSNVGGSGRLNVVI